MNKALPYYKLRKVTDFLKEKDAYLSVYVPPSTTPSLELWGFMR